LLYPSRSLWRRALQVRVSQNNTRNCKTKTKTKTDFVGPQTGLVLRPTVSDHITGLGNFIFTYTLASIVLFTARNSDVTKRDIRYVCCPSPKWPTVSSGTLNSTVPIPYVVLVISDKFQLRHSGIHSLNVDWHLYRQWWADFFCDFLWFSQQSRSSQQSVKHTLESVWSDGYSLEKWAWKFNTIFGT